LTKFTIIDSEESDLSLSKDGGENSRRTKKWIMTTPEIINAFLGCKLQNK
jgi:hypothetical protein